MSKKQKVDSGSEVERNHKACSKLLKAMQRNPDCELFLEPVDWKALGLPLYPKIVKKPMDLGTVEKKLQSNKYASVEDFANDVRLIWSNCQAFNQEGSDLNELAGHLAGDFEGKMSGQLVKCKAVLKELKKRPDVDIFLEPVPWKELGLTDYPALIKRPMDVGTVSKGLDAGKYSSVHDVASDVDLIWTNAMDYNQDGSGVYEIAAKLKAWSDKKMAPLLAAAGGADDAPGELTSQMKHELHERAATLNPKDLYGLVGVFESVCRRGVDQVAAHEVEVDFDSLDLCTFVKVDQYVQDCLGGTKKKGKQ